MSQPQPYQDELAEDALESGESWEDTSDALQEDALEGESLEEGFEAEEEQFEEADGLEEEAAEEGFEESDAMEQQFEEADGLEEEAAEEGFEEGFEDQGAEAAGEESFDEADLAGEGVESIFLDTLDDEDEFLGRLLGLARGFATRAAPVFRQGLGTALQGLGQAAQAGGQSDAPWKAAAQIVGMLPVRNAERWGGLVEALGRPASAWAAPRLQDLAARLAALDHMDVFADAVDEYAAEGADAEEFAPPLGGFAARYVVKKAISPKARRTRPAGARALGAATARAVERSTRALVRKYGAKAAPAVARIVRTAVRTVTQRRVSPARIPRLITRAAAKALRRPAVVRRLSRPVPAVRRLRARRNIRPGAPLRGYAPSAVRSYGRRRRWRTLTLRGPVRISFRR